jgi:hypothetical protein
MPSLMTHRVKKPQRKQYIEVLLVFFKIISFGSGGFIPWRNRVYQF